uniref:Ig-like domain-containing protein n=1 Tax=Cyprinus carpio TaxID=7962 RepID=A0A8C1LQY5_CYPCA
FVYSKVHLHLNIHILMKIVDGCHLSPKTSAVDMEIRWFKETDCVCFYKNRRLIEGESYEGIMSLCTEELERGIVSLQLKDVRESHVGDYLCQKVHKLYFSYLTFILQVCIMF